MSLTQWGGIEDARANKKKIVLKMLMYFNIEMQLFLKKLTENPMCLIVHARRVGAS